MAKVFGSLGSLGGVRNITIRLQNAIAENGAYGSHLTQGFSEVYFNRIWPSLRTLVSYNVLVREPHILLPELTSTPFS